MNPIAFILIGVGTYLLANETNSEKVIGNEQNGNDSGKRGSTGGDSADSARCTDSKRDGSGRVKQIPAKPNPKKENTNESSGNELERPGHDDGNQSGDHLRGEQYGSPGRGETESVTNAQTFAETEGETDERETDCNDSGGDNGGDVRRESSSGNESAGTSDS